ncbi:hypothetical protein [Candidatus Enterovibrio altilux]|uniref:Mobile element protein n=1 Tax=Candidatus Enterovibrio altilux TaxID=1927128 RepID=A0A291BBL4_9GAMM|nr:hypothetical protein BTN50_1993 [Candidatus Enterovibrio luxaltus]
MTDDGTCDVSKYYETVRIKRAVSFIPSRKKVTFGDEVIRVI